MACGSIESEDFPIHDIFDRRRWRVNGLSVTRDGFEGADGACARRLASLPWIKRREGYPGMQGRS